jgi:hypothetical protein
VGGVLRRRRLFSRGPSTGSSHARTGTRGRAPGALPAWGEVSGLGGGGATFARGRRLTGTMARLPDGELKIAVRAPNQIMTSLAKCLQKRPRDCGLCSVRRSGSRRTAYRTGGDGRQGLERDGDLLSSAACICFAHMIVRDRFALACFRPFPCVPHCTAAVDCSRSLLTLAGAGCW